MLKKLSRRSSPLSKPSVSSNSGFKFKSQPLIKCSAALPNLTAAKTAPEACSTQGELLPPEIVISILNGFATSLLLDQEKFELLKAKCLEGAKLGQDDATTGSILKSSHTVLTYLTWGIRHIEKASASLQQGEKESIEEHLNSAEQMLKSLIESMQLELNDHPNAILSNVRVPNASFILGLAHVFLALVCKLRKNTSNLVASHLLEAFIVSPRNARQSFIPELWNQLFCPHLSAVEGWYKKEHANIFDSFSRSPSIAAGSKPSSPTVVNSAASPKAASTVVSRANSLMELVSGMRVSKRGTNSRGSESKVKQNEHDQTRLLEKMNMQVKLLTNLYERSLNEGTVEYARHYQDVIVSYYGRFSCDQRSNPTKLLQSETNDGYQLPLAATTSPNRNDKKEVRICGDEAGTQVDDDDAVEGKLLTESGWMGANALQLRRSLFDTVFGTAPITKTRKQDSTSPSSQISGVLRICNKALPQVIDPLRQKVETDACTPASSHAPSGKSSSAAGKPATIRDVVNAAFSPIPQEQDMSNTCTTVRASMSGHSLSAKSFVEIDLLSSDSKSSNLINNGVSKELPPDSCKSSHRQSTSKQADVRTSYPHSKRLIDFIQVKDRQPNTQCSPTPSHDSHDIETQFTTTCQQTKMSASDISKKSTKVEGRRIIKKRNSESSGTNHTSQWTAPVDQELKRKMTAKVGSHASAPAPAKMGAGKPTMVQNEDTEEVQVKYCTSLQVQQTRSLSTSSSKVHNMSECTSMDNTNQAIFTSADASVEKSMCNQLNDLANELRSAVRATQSSNNAAEDMGRCEEVLLQLSQAWLECKSAALLQRKGIGDKETDSLASTGEVLEILDGLTHELLFILANSELQEAQRLALCLLSASVGASISDSNASAQLSQHDSDVNTQGECNKSNGKQLPSDPNVLHALSHLLQQQGRLPEAALLLHLFHPGQYSTSCHNFLPHLLPLLLDLAQHNTMPTTQFTYDHIASSCGSPFDGHLDLIGDSLKPRALALKMMSRLLATVDKVARLQACKHVLFPNVNALPCLLYSLDCAPSVDERIAAAFILTTCMQADDTCRQHIVNHVKLPSVVALLQQSATNSNAFQTAIDFVTELLRTRKANITEMLSCIRHDGLLNCMHALMAYLQTASLENQPPAAGLLLQLDLLLGDEQRYSVFREEALEALLSPLLKESNREASFSAAHVLSTIGRSHSEQELEAWLLKKAGLGSTLEENKLNTGNQSYMSSTPNHTAPASKGQDQEEEEEGTLVAQWDKRVACAIIDEGGGGLVSTALAKGMQSSMAEVRKACLLVVAWLTSHLNSMRSFDQQYPVHHQVYRQISDQSRASAKRRMREALQAQLQEIAAAGSGNAIVERVFAALALQNLAK